MTIIQKNQSRLALKTWSSRMLRGNLSTHTLYPPLPLAGNNVYVLADTKVEREANCWGVRWIINRFFCPLSHCQSENLKDEGFRVILLWCQSLAGSLSKLLLPETLFPHLLAPTSCLLRLHLYKELSLGCYKG